MINPLKYIVAEASGFGDSIAISFQPDTDYTSEHKVYFFKRSKQDVTDQEIADYFTAKEANTLDKFSYNGLMVFDNMPPESNVLADFTVLNDTLYYYKAVIRNETTFERSTSVSVNIMPVAKLTFDIGDGKDIVKQAIEKMFDCIKYKNGEKAKIGKDIKIIKNFAIDPIIDNYIMIERINGSTQYQFWGQQAALYSRYAGSTRYGDIDNDIIRATFITKDTPERRDLVGNIFRGMKQWLIQRCKYIDKRVDDCKITIEGDYYNPQVHGDNATGFIVVFSLLIENNLIVED